MIQPPNVPGAEPNAPNSPSPLLKPGEDAASPPSHGGDDDASNDTAVPRLEPRDKGS